MKKILILFEYNIKNGGAQKSIIEIIKNNTEDNKFYSLMPLYGDYSSYLNELGVETYYGGSKEYWPGKENILKFLLNLFQVIKKSKKIIKENKIDTVYCTMLPSLLVGVANKLLFFKNIKIVWHDRVTENSKVFILIFKLISKRIDTIITTTPYGYNKIAGYGYNKEKLYMIPNSTDFCNENISYVKKINHDNLKIALIGRI
ncbi:MAG: glycosyltransferase, partial [Clostridium sp.]|uniref:glycosyltransferase n=1 Tax=Clostridium sp. TaxID=1506 RepID=UPI00290F1709